MRAERSTLSIGFTLPLTRHSIIVASNFTCGWKEGVRTRKEGGGRSKEEGGSTAEEGEGPGFISIRKVALTYLHICKS